MATTTMDVAPDAARAARPMSLPKAAWLQVMPGLASLPVFAILAWLFAGRGMPVVFALALTILLVEVPLSWFILIRVVRQETGGRFSFGDAFPWAAAISWRYYLLIGVPLIVFSMIMIGGVGPRIESLLIGTAFGWVPDWFVMRAEPASLGALSRPALLTLWVLMLVAMVIAGGVTQELYSRGFLLPRMRQAGPLAPAVNALFFAMLHAIAPWGWPAFFLMTLAWAYAVWWLRSVRIGIFVHVGMLGLQWLGMTMLVFGLVDVPM